jgi:hypothetical protein
VTRPERAGAFLLKQDVWSALRQRKLIIMDDETTIDHVYRKSMRSKYFDSFVLVQFSQIGFDSVLIGINL